MPHLVRSSAFRATAAALAVMLAAPHVAHAAGPTKAQCVDANTQAQTLIQDHKLHAAREALRVCATSGCPSAVQNDCTERLDAVEHEMPSIVFDVKDGDGNDLSAVKVTVDGAPFVDKLDGSPIEIDPGEHDISFEVSGQAAVTKKILLHDSEKSRHEAVVIGEPTAKPQPVVIPKFTPPPPRPFNVQKVAGASLAVVGVLTMTVGAFLGLSASSQNPSASCSLPISCGANASLQGKQDDASDNASASTIFFIAGGVLAAGGVVLFLTAPKKESPPTAARVFIAPSAAPGGGGLLMRGAF